MCSICGGEYPSFVIQNASNTMLHRGRNHSGIFEAQNLDFVLAHNRLSIIDLNCHANQPFVSPIAPHLVLVYNGEIFNYQAIKQELKNEGIVFETHSDTEVLFAAYAVWGEECLNKFNGDFAFVFLDIKKQTLFIARDRLGNKPLYYTFKNHRFFFASEIKAFFEVDCFEFDELHVSSWLVFGGALGHQSIYKDIFNFPPGHYARLKIGSSKIQPIRYWNFTPQAPTIHHLDAALEELEYLLLDSVRLRLIADVSVALSVSGGIDSSLIAHCVKKLELSCKMFGVSFKDVKGSDERVHIAQLSKDLNCDIACITPNLDLFVADFPTLVHVHDEIFRSFSVYAQFLLFKELAQYCVVALGGQGADELFGGYYHHVARFLAAHKEAKDEREKLYGKQACDEYNFGMQCMMSTKEKTQRFLKDNKLHFKQLRKRHLRIPSLEYLMQRFIPDFTDSLWNDVQFFSLPSLLRYEDRNAMWFGVENRCPFTDYRIVEFAFKLAPELKFHKGYSKYLLRKLLEKFGSFELAWRLDKIGFGAPESALLKRLGYNYSSVFDVRLAIFDALRKLRI